MIENVKDIITGRFVGITGGAGSGKTTLTNRLGFDTYHIDTAFFGDSAYRRWVLENKSKTLDSFIDSCNMYNWWNWDAVESSILNERPICETYIVEGALLGTEWLLNEMELIIFLYDSPQNRFNKLLLRDGHKRGFHELLERFMITEYSESKYYNYVFSNFWNKIVVIDTNYNFLNFFPEISTTLALPLKVHI